jgi:hypothetical protein
MAAWNLSAKQTATAAGAALAILGAVAASDRLYEFLLGHVPEALAHGIKMLFSGLIIVAVQRFLLYVFRSRRGGDEPYPYMKAAALLILLVTIIEVFRALT